MAKKSRIQNEKNKKIIINKYLVKRVLICEIWKSIKKFGISNIKNVNQILEILKKLQNFPKNSCFIRFRNRCWNTGRNRGYYRFFGLCRNMIRTFSNYEYLPGLLQSSW